MLGLFKKCKSIFAVLILLSSVIVVYRLFVREPRGAGKKTPITDSPFLLSTAHGRRQLIMTISDGAGLGNMLFRIASLYGISKDIHRSLCIDGLYDQYYKELSTAFSNLEKFPMKKTCQTNPIPKNVDFAGNAWRYDNVSRLQQYHAEQVIRFPSDIYLQSFKFFEHSRDEILFLFDFSDVVKRLVDVYAKLATGAPKSVNVCAHVRNFESSHLLLPSDATFTVNALNYILQDFVPKERQAALLLFADDVGLARRISRRMQKTLNLSKTFIVEHLTRTESIALASRHCDYFLISSSGSTFGYWSAFLMPEAKQSNVFYNSLFFKPKYRGMAKDFREDEFFPAAWKRLFWDTRQQKVLVQDRATIPLVSV